MPNIKPIPVRKYAMIDSAFRAVEGRARVRCCDHTDVLAAVKEAERRLKGVPQKHWKGTTVEVDPHIVAAGYGFPARGTVFRLVRRSRDWALDEAWRDATKLAPNGVRWSNWLRVCLPAGLDMAEVGRSLTRFHGLAVADV
jgi:hypothetical protein